MNIIGVILTIALSAFLMSAVAFYGGPAYKQSRVKAELAKLDSDFNHISLAVKNHDVNFGSSQSEVNINELIKEGGLSEKPFFDDGKNKAEYELRPNFTYYNNEKMNFIYVQIGDNRQLCDLVNSNIYREGYGSPVKIDWFLFSDFLREGSFYGEPRPKAGSMLVFLTAQQINDEDFLDSPERANKKVCFYRGERNGEDVYEVVYVIDIGSLYKDSRVMIAKEGV